MVYNGLKDDMDCLSKFVYIYETCIKTKSNVSEFSQISNSAAIHFKQHIQPKVKFATQAEIATTVFTKESKKTLLFTSDGKAQIYNFCRHLRNSFVHGLLENDSDEKLVILDNIQGKITAKGSLDYKTVKDFIVLLISEYEKNVK